MGSQDNVNDGVHGLIREGFKLILIHGFGVPIKLFHSAAISNLLNMVAKPKNVKDEIVDVPNIINIHPEVMCDLNVFNMQQENQHHDAEVVARANSISLFGQQLAKERCQIEYDVQKHLA